MKISWSKIFLHIAIIASFAIVSLCYFYPVLQGKAIHQSDIVQYIGMAKEQNDFRKAENSEPYWTNSAFGGMPTYQLGAKYPHNYIKELDSVLRFLPRPADYLFLYFIGFYILLLTLRVSPLKSFFGALAFGFSTYLIIILGVGHNAKAHAIAYMPMVVAGVLLIFQRRYILGGLLTMLAASLEIQANHFQMTYYLLILLIIISIFYFYKYIKEKEYKVLLRILGIFLVVGIISIGVNATNLLATSEYAKVSTRSNSSLTFNPDGSKKTTSNAMTYEYITEYSYGRSESLNLIAPRLFGGGNSEKLDEKSNLHQFLMKNIDSQYVSYFRDNLGNTYWGDQPIVAAPAYIGAVIFFLFVLSLFVVKRRIKYVFLTGAIVSLLLSWGKNFSFLTDFFINYVPLYNKFRAVSSIQVILELCIPALAIMGLAAFTKSNKEVQWNSLKKAGLITIGLFFILLISKSLFSFSSPNDVNLVKYLNYITKNEGFGDNFLDALKQDRMQMYTSDIIKSLSLVVIVIFVLVAMQKQKIKSLIGTLIIGVLMVGDLVLIARNYVNEEHFVDSRQMEQPFNKSSIDQIILKDTSHYRVFEPQGGMSSARTSFFHKSIGGYSAVKPKKIQELYDYQITKNNMEVLNMLNVKYIITDKEEPILNDKAYGNAWFINRVESVKNADEELKALDKLDKNTAIINVNKFKTNINSNFITDSLSSIQLMEYKPNYLKYESENSHDGFAVFSEVYYPKGWIATIDGVPTDILEVNYMLRAISIPKGKHKVEFRFEPQVVKIGSRIALGSFVVMILLIITGSIWSFRECKN